MNRLEKQATHAGPVSITAKVEVAQKDCDIVLPIRVAIRDGQRVTLVGRSAKQTEADRFKDEMEA